MLAAHCSGGVILGFHQFTAKEGVYKMGTSEQKSVKSKINLSIALESA
jgi:hypothetical protein